MAKFTEESIVYLNALTYLPTNLTHTNFPVWRRQLLTCLTGFKLLGFIDGTNNPPTQYKTITNESGSSVTTEKAEYDIWNRQDQIIFNAMLSSCTEPIQPYISHVLTAKEAWQCLVTTFANNSWSRVMSLKESLMNNTRGPKTLTTYLKEMQGFAHNLALTGSPVSNDDLTLHILNNLGEDYKEINAAIRARDSPISFEELCDKLRDFEITLKKGEIIPTSASPVVTANYANRHEHGVLERNYSHGRNYSHRSGNGQASQGNSSFQRRQHSQAPRWQQTCRPTGSYTRSDKSKYCQFCERSGHNTKECRQFNKFCKDNGLQVLNHAGTSPAIVNASVPNLHPTNHGFLIAAHHIMSQQISVIYMSTQIMADQTKFS